MAQELYGLDTNETFTAAEAPDDRRPLGAKCLYKYKVNSFGEITKFKARLVAKGFSQVPGIDFLETYAPTPASSSIRLLVASAVQYDLDLMHFDIDQGFCSRR